MRFERHLRYFAGITAIVMAGSACAWLSAHSRWSLDLSAARRNTLDPASVAAVNAVSTPIAITAYLPENAPERVPLRELVSRYQRAGADIEVSFIKPSDAPESMRSTNINSGELIVRSGARTERITAISEHGITNAVARLLRQGQQWIAVVTGHGERRISREANHDISILAQALRERGLELGEINLGERVTIPDNTTLLIIASPALAYYPGEIALLEKYLHAGGNLLWFTEPDAPAEMQSLADLLAITQLPGTVIDPVTQALGIDNPAVAVITRYADHSALRGLDLMTLFPHAASLRPHADSPWRTSSLFATGEKTWIESGPIAGQVAHDPDTEPMGPHPLAWALQRDHPNSRVEQRIVVVGDGDFLSNTYLGNGGNQLLAIRLIEWLLGSNELIAIETPRGNDHQVELKPWHVAVIGFGFLIILPAACVLNGLWWHWRRRA